MSAAPNYATLHPELADFAGQISRIRDDAKKLTSNLSEAQLNWRTHSSCWSVAQCLQHIVLGHQAYLPPIDASIKQAREQQFVGSGPFKYGWFGNWFARSLDAPPKFKMKNPKVITPPRDLAGGKAVADFDRVHEELLRRVYEVNGIDLRRAKMTSPFLRLLRLSLGQAFAVLTAHARRHVWQAWQVRNHPAFPKA
jgi:DinB family protein